MREFLKLTEKKFTLTTIFSVVAFAMVFIYGAGSAGGLGGGFPLWIKLIAPGLLLPPPLGGFWIVLLVATIVLYWYLIVSLVAWLWNKRKAN